MTWEYFKRWLYERNRVVELNNKGSGREIITTWNGLIASEMWPKDWINILYRSGKPRMLIRKEFVAPAKTIYDYPTYRDVVVGYEQAPQKQNKQLALLML